MENLPKIVLQRLRQGSAGASPKAPSTTSGRAGRGEHPDADLLAAFVEKKLTEGERVSVMKHLADCSECREVVALAWTPGTGEVQAVSVVGRGRPAWFTMPIVRWGAISAALGAILVAVFLYRPAPELFRERTETKRPLPPAAAPAPSAAKTEMGAPAATETYAEIVRRGIPAKPGVGSTSTNLNQPSAKQAGASGEVAGIVGRPEPSSSEDALAKAEPSRGYSVGGPITSAAPSAPAVPGPAQSAATKTSNAEVARAQTQGVEVKKDELDVAAESRKAGSLAAIQQAEGAPRAKGLLKSGSTLRETAAKTGAKALLPGVRWSISITGKVERSLDGGTTWQELHVNDSLVFRVVTATGSEVWAGGARGALYHSVDGGETWTRVYLDPDRSSPDDAIVRINFTDPLHGQVTTAAGERWITSDGGRHWTQE